MISNPKLSRTSTLPLYQRSIDWDAFYAKYPPPDIFAETTWKSSADQVRAIQNERFLDVIRIGWENPFYQSLWTKSGLAPGDIRSLDDIGKLPIYTTDDIKSDQEANPPFGLARGFSDINGHLQKFPTKLQSSGGTTGKPRLALHSPVEWEGMGITIARALYLRGARPGDIMQIPATCSLAGLAWAFYKACHDYLGILPLTTGSGVVTPSRRQVEIAFDVGTSLWAGFPEYLIRLAKTSQEEFGRDIRDLRTKFITSYLGPDTEGTLRAQIQDLWGCPVYDGYGANEIGLGAFECIHQRGLHFEEDLMYFEVLDVDTNQPVPIGKPGNLVVTAFYRSVHPVIRFNLRDLSRIVSTERCECGSSFRRMDHMLGRSDSMVRMRGVNVYPMACLPAIKSDKRTTGEWVCEAYIRETNGESREELAVHVEVRKDAGGLDGLKEHLEGRLKADLGLSLEVRLVEEGSLATEGHLGEGKVKRLIERRPGFKAPPK